MPKDIKHIRNGISCQSQIKISHPIPQRKQIQVQRIPRNHIISNHNSRLCLLCSNNISAVCIRLLNVKNFLWRPQILINNRNNMIAGAYVLIIHKNVGKGWIAGSYFTNNHPKILKRAERIPPVARASPINPVMISQRARKNIKITPPKRSMVIISEVTETPNEKG